MTCWMVRVRITLAEVPLTGPEEESISWIQRKHDLPVV